MSHECHHGSCSHKTHSHSASCCHGSEGSEYVCCDCGCHHKSHKHSDELLALADEAWMELLKEKIKEEINKYSSQHIEEIASLVAKSNHARWKCKMEEKKNHHLFEDELQNIVCRQK
jgi:hypothetical protein